MMIRLALFALLVLCGARSAEAQLSTADLQSIAVADAQQYGVPVQLFLDQIQAESSFNPNAVNSASGAEGIAQFLPSTAADAGYGIAPFDPLDPAAALSAAAQYDAALYNANGNNWTSAITAYSGGLTPSNPGDYGTVFADAAAANAGNTGTVSSGGVTVTDTTGTSVGAAAPAASGVAATPVFGPFSFLWDEYVNNVVTPLNQLLGNVQTWVAGLIIYLIALLGMSLGVRIWAEELDINDLVKRTLIVAAVLALEGAGSVYYQNYVINTFNGLSASLGSAITGNSSANIGQFLDNIWHAFYADLPAITWNLPGFGLSQSALDALLEVVAIAIVGWGLTVCFFEYFRATFILQVMFIFGPIILPSAMFDGFRDWAWRWLSTVLALILASVAAQMMVWIVVKVVMDLFTKLPSGATSTQATVQSSSLFGAALVVGAVAWLTHEVVRFAHGLSGYGAARPISYGQVAGAAGSAAKGAAGAVAALV